MTRACKPMTWSDSTVLVTRLWLDSTKSWLDSDSTQPSHDSTGKNFRWLWLKACVTLTRKKWLEHITASQTYQKRSGDVILGQCFLTGWMVHPRVNEIFARVNETRGVNKGWMKFLFLILCVLWKHVLVLFLFKTYQQSWIKWRTSSILALHLQQSAT